MQMLYTIVYLMPRSESNGLSDKFGVVAKRGKAEQSNSSRSLLVLEDIFYNECYDSAINLVLILGANTCRTVQYAEFTSTLLNPYVVWWMRTRLVVVGSRVRILPAAGGNVSQIGM